MLKKITPVGIVYYICDESGKFYDKNKEEIKPNDILKKCEKSRRKFILTKASEKHNFCNKLIEDLEKGVIPVEIEKEEDEIIEERQTKFSMGKSKKPPKYNKEKRIVTVFGETTTEIVTITEKQPVEIEVDIEINGEITK